MGEAADREVRRRSWRTDRGDDAVSFTRSLRRAMHNQDPVRVDHADAVRGR